MADLELDNLFKSIANQDFSTEKKSELDEIFDNIKNNRFVSKERELLDDVFQNNPQIVDYYFTERGKNPEFQLTKDTIEQFNLEKEVPKLSFDSISGFFKSAASQKDTDLDRFSNLTGTKFVYPLKNSDEQNELNTYYNVTRRAKPWKEQEYKPSFSENIAIGSAEGLNRAAKGVTTAVAELVDRGFDTDYTTAIENNWATMNLEDNGVADFARFSIQYGVPYGTSLKIFNKLKDIHITNIEKNNIDLNINIDKHFDKIIGNEDRMLTVFSNLIDNSIKYSEKNKSIKVLTSKSVGKLVKPGVKISIIDEGIGIPQNQIIRITERFYRVDIEKSKKVGGTGLGLAIMKHIVTQHRGEFEIKSQLGKGTEINIHIPSEL